MSPNVAKINDEASRRKARQQKNHVQRYQRRSESPAQFVLRVFVNFSTLQRFFLQAVSKRRSTAAFLQMTAKVNKIKTRL